MNNKIAVAVSGTGRSLQNLLDRQVEYSYEIVAVISSKTGCGGEKIATEFNLPVIPFDNYTSKESLEKRLMELQVNWILLAGFIKKFPLLKHYRLHTINIHPSLLPKFGGRGMYGLNVHKAVKEANETKSGVSIHYVTEEYDQGKIIAQQQVNINCSESAEDIARKVFEIECQLYPRTIDSLIKNETTGVPS